MHLRDQFGLAVDDVGPNLARAVYGSDHFNEEHAEYQKYYKPKYLK